MDAVDALALCAGLKTKTGDSFNDQGRDVRALHVLFDAAEEQWRTLGEALPEHEAVDFEDFPPLQQPRAWLRDMRQLRRMGMDFVQHHESWLKKSGVCPSDRSVSEHSSLCRALNYLACYDQLSLPALATCRRGSFEPAKSTHRNGPRAARSVLLRVCRGDGTQGDGGRVGWSTQL